LHTPEFPDIIHWRAETNQIGELGELENRYVDGFYEYTLAFYLNQIGHLTDAKRHFEDAFGLLLPFRTPLAHSAQCVLGLRMNCFGVLSRAPKASAVEAANHFFNDGFPSGWQPPKTYLPGDPFATYADEFTVRLVDVLVAFYQTDPLGLWAGIEALDFHPSGKEKNNEDKVFLLKARGYRRQHQKDLARKMYQLLRYNPLFSKEAEAYLS
jgi:hypothetical protein